MMKRKIFLISIVMAVCFELISLIAIRIRYPQLDIDSEALIGDNGESLKEFAWTKDGLLTAESDDPWAYHALPETMDVSSVKIVIDLVDPQDTWAQLHFILQDGSWVHQSFFIHDGTNRIDLFDGNRALKDVSVIRFDLVSLKGAVVKVDKIVINSTGSLMMRCHLISLLAVLLLSVVVGAFDRRNLKGHRFREIASGIAVSSSAVFLLFVFAPLDLYFNNWEEFWFDMYDLLPLIAVWYLAGVLVSNAVLWTLSLWHERAYQIGLVFVDILLICTYIQGNFLVKDLPFLDGSTIDWNAHLSGRYHTIVLWSIVILAVVILIKAVSLQRFCAISGYISLGITGMLLLTLCIECVTTYGYQDKQNALITTKGQFEFSADANFIIFLVDAVDSSTFRTVVEDDARYKEMLADFTYYPDTMGAYPCTSRSIPFILSGEWFENTEMFARYNERVYRESPLLTELEERDYRLALYETEMPLTDESIFRFDNVIEQDVRIDSYSELASLEMKLIGFRYAPFDLKRSCVIYPNAFSIRKKSKESVDEAFTLDNKAFYDAIREQAVTYSDRKCFKFIHIEGGHTPYRYDKEVNIIQNGTYEQNVQASMTIVGAYLERLRNAGVYDGSVIVIMADHGYEVRGYAYGKQNPLLLIKGTDEHHAFQVSEAPISYADLPAAYERLLDDRRGDEVFDWQAGDVRERRYMWYEFLKEDHMVEYVQTGSAADPSAMYPTGREYDAR